MKYRSLISSLFVFNILMFVMFGLTWPMGIYTVCVPIFALLFFIPTGEE